MAHKLTLSKAINSGKITISPEWNLPAYDEATKLFTDVFKKAAFAAAAEAIEVMFDDDENQYLSVDFPFISSYEDDPPDIDPLTIEVRFTTEEWEEDYYKHLSLEDAMWFADEALPSTIAKFTSALRLLADKMDKKCHDANPPK